MITQIVWLACLPALMFVTYKLIALTYKQLDKKNLL